MSDDDELTLQPAAGSQRILRPRASAKDNAAFLASQAAMSTAERLALLEQEYDMAPIDDEDDVRDMHVERLGDKTAAIAEEQERRKQLRAEARIQKAKDKAAKPTSKQVAQSQQHGRQLTLEESRGTDTLNIEATLAALQREEAKDLANFDYARLLAAERDDDLNDDGEEAVPFDMSRILGLRAPDAAAPAAAPTEAPAAAVAPEHQAKAAAARSADAPAPAATQPAPRGALPSATAKALEAHETMVAPATQGAQGKRNFAVKEENPTAARVAATEAPDALAPALPSGPALATCDAEGRFVMYWFDAREQSHMSVADPGSVMLFGRTRVQDGTWRSCCLRVRNVERCVMICPKPGSSEADVINEVSALCRDRGIKKRKVKKVDRWYAFEEEAAPRDRTTWYKLKYEASQPPLLDSFSEQPKLEHIARLFGVHRSLLELFLIKRRFTGPGFITAAGVTQIDDASKLSHCDVELVIDNPKNVNPADGDMLATLTAPPLIAASIQIHAQIDSSKNTNEIFGVALCFQRVHADKTTPDAGNPDFVIGFRAPTGTVIPFEFQQHCRKQRLSNVRTFGSEYALLTWAMEQLRQRDPDLLVGHNFIAFTLDVMLHRMNTLRVPDWSLLGRLRLRVMPKLQTGAGGTKDSTYQEREVCNGRLIMDTYLLAREHHRATNYKLTVLADDLKLQGLFEAGAGRVRDEQPDLRKATFSCEMLFEACAFSAHQALVALSLSNRLDFVPLTKGLCALAGNLWSRTLTGSRSERIEYLLLHAFHRAKFVTPDRRGYGQSASAVVKQEPGTATAANVKRERHAAEANANVADVVEEAAAADDEEAAAAAGEDDTAGPAGGAAVVTRKKAKYKGGMVLEPKTGLYKEYILLLDFNSLYPSIIQEFDICFTTIKRRVGEAGGLPVPDDLVCDACKRGHDTWRQGGACRHRCVLPRVIYELVASRRQVKKLMTSERDPSMLSQLEIRQKALKLTANSMYGCLGFEHSRFYAQRLAELVTEKGREALAKACTLVESVQLPDGNRLDVIYGDTDSVMIRTQQRDLAKVREIAERIRVDVNKMYKKLEIGVDGVFCSMLLHTKKKYAALTVEDFMGDGKHIKREVKGLDMVRRDWCAVTKQACSAVLDCLLDHNIGLEDAVDTVVRHMRQLALNVRSGAVFELPMFCVSKSLTRDPELYKDINQPHVQVALRMKERNEQVRSGDIIPYIICNENYTSDEQHGEAAAAAPSGGQAQAVTSRLAMRAYHVNEVRANPSLTIDVEWYLATQVLPPVSRICEHVDGFTMQQLADAMEIQGNYASLAAADGAAAGDVNGGLRRDQYASSAFRGLSLEDAFPLAQPFYAPCRRCRIASRIHPHERVRNLVELALQGKLVGPSSTPTSLENSATKPSPLSATATDAAANKKRHMFRVHLYVCEKCGVPLDLKVITHWTLYALHTCRADFYASRGDPINVERVKQQLLYLRSLFDVPRHIDVMEREAHLNVLRLWEEGTARLRAMCDRDKLGADALDNPPLLYVTEAYEQLFGTMVDAAMLVPAFFCMPLKKAHRAEE